MRRNIALLAYLVLIALLLAPALVRADDAAGLAIRQQPEALGDTVMLSDVFDGVPAASDASVARAAAPGSTVTLDPEALRQIARRQGLVWANAEGLRRVVVRTPSRQVPADAVAALVADAIARDAHETYLVALTNSQPLHAPIDAALAPEVTALTLESYSGSFTAEITLAPGLAPVRVTGSAEPSLTMPVLSRAIARDQVVTEADISFVETPASRVPADALADASEIVGLSARRALRAGVILKSFDLERPTLIARGDVVTVRFERGALTLTARARALDDVAEGEQARFVNLQSSRTIEAIATGPGEAWLVASTATGSIGGSR
jgi:flagella basal body P-ring formation protein FlgA